MRQVQGRDHGVPIYRMPVQIGIVTPSGKRIETVWLEREQDVFLFPSQEEPLLVRFDEGNWLLKEWSYEKAVTELLYQARHDDVIGREWAIRELGRFGDDERVLEAMAVIVRSDPFWAVRVAAVEVLSDVGQAGAERLPGRVDVFRHAATDASSRVRRAAIRSLGNLDEPDQVQFIRDRFTADDSYQVQAEALRAIGRTGDRRQLPFLREASQMESHQDVIRRAAEWAIEEISGG